VPRLTCEHLFQASAARKRHLQIDLGDAEAAVSYCPSIVGDWRALEKIMWRRSIRTGRDTRIGAGAVISPTHHSDVAQLSDYLIGNCSPGSALLISRHAVQCERCRDLVEPVELVRGDVIEGRTPGEWLRLATGGEILILPEHSGLGELAAEIRLAPAARLPLGALLPLDELLVLEGSLRLADRTAIAGDFLSMLSGEQGDFVAHHETGCSLIVTASDPDFDGEA
jgi:hypothetical protein